MSLLRQAILKAQGPLEDLGASGFAQAYLCQANSLLFAGHFPNHPVLPAVTELFMVLNTLELIVGQKVLLKKVQQGKLLASVEPDCSLVIKIKPIEPLIYAATLLVKEEVVARFKLEIELA